MQTVKISTSQNIDIDYEVASLGDRILGYLIDGAIFVALYIAVIIVSLFFGFERGSSSFMGIGIAVIVWLLLFVFYDLICEIFFNGQTIGKRTMKTRVISLDGSSPTLGQYLLRWLFRIVDFSLTSSVGAIISVAVTKNKQRIGDIVAGTAVIKTVPRTAIEHIAFAPSAAVPDIVFPEVSVLHDKDIVLIHEILLNFKNNGNYTLLRDTAQRVKDHLSVDTRNMDDLTFLQTIIRDYNHISAWSENGTEEIAEEGNAGRE